MAKAASDKLQADQKQQRDSKRAPYQKAIETLRSFPARFVKDGKGFEMSDSIFVDEVNLSISLPSIDLNRIDSETKGRWAQSVIGKREGYSLQRDKVVIKIANILDIITYPDSNDYGTTIVEVKCPGVYSATRLIHYFTVNQSGPYEGQWVGDPDGTGFDSRQLGRNSILLFVAAGDADAVAQAIRVVAKGPPSIN